MELQRQGEIETVELGLKQGNRAACGLCPSSHHHLFAQFRKCQGSLLANSLSPQWFEQYWPYEQMHG